MEEISRPFTQTAVNVTASHAPLHCHLSEPAATLDAPHRSMALRILTVFFVWITRWLRISAATRQARPLSDGREARKRSAAWRPSGVQKPIALLQSRFLSNLASSGSSSLSWCGRRESPRTWMMIISRPFSPTNCGTCAAATICPRQFICGGGRLLVLPVGLVARARLIDERERACDEEVSRLGSDPQVYAESILKTCEFCVGSPLPCVSGVTGADLKKRIVRIMTDAFWAQTQFREKNSSDCFRHCSHNRTGRFRRREPIASPRAINKN